MPRTKPTAIQMQKYLKGIKYPATRDQLIIQAKVNNAENDLISVLEELKDESFKTPAEVSKAIGK